MATAEQAAIQTIEQQLTPIAEEVSRTEARLLELNQSKARLEAALKALTGETKGKTMEKRKRKPQQPYTTKQDVMRVCMVLATHKPPLNHDEFTRQVKERLKTELGFNLSGVQMRLRECLASRRFQITEAGQISLTPEADAKLRNGKVEANTKPTHADQPDKPQG